MEELYNVAIKNLKHKASYMEANAIIGLKVDFGEISGKDKSMFMVSMVGTAVKISYCTSSDTAFSNGVIGNISSMDLANEIIKYSVLQLLNTGEASLANHWQYLFTNSNYEITTLLLDIYLHDCVYVCELSYNIDLPSNLQLLHDKIGQYFKRVDTATATKALYLKIVDYPQFVIEILKNNLLFSPKDVIEILKDGKIDTAISCLSIDKEYYTAEDLIQMTEMLNMFDNLPDIGEVKMVKGGLLSKDKDKYACPAGHHNDVSVEYCTSCDLNIKGLVLWQVNDINTFRLKVDALKSLFSAK